MTTLDQPPPSYVAPLPEREAIRAESSEGWGQRVSRFVGDHPIWALAAGAAMGILIGCLVKRR